jgi:hypothetical protein
VQPVGAALQVQAPLGNEPVQVWLLPQVLVPETTMQPLPSAAQVVVTPPVQKLPAPVQPAGGGLQVQAPPGNEPVQVWLPPQLTVLDTNEQPSPSTAQVVELPVPLQNEPAPAQPAGAALQAQLAPPPEVTQAECGPHVTAPPQTAQPASFRTQVSTPPLAPQRVAPGVHIGVQA